MELDTDRIDRSRVLVSFGSVEDTLHHIEGEWILVTTDQETHQALSYMWPSGGQMIINMSNLPVDRSTVTALETAIRDWFEAPEEVAGRLCIKLPVEQITIDHANDRIVIVADSTRIDEMCPMPV